MSTEPPLSPSKAHKTAPVVRVVPLDLSVREQVIHPELPKVKFLKSDLKPCQYHLLLILF